MGVEFEKQLRVMSKAWGNQSGWCFFPWIPGDAADKESRIKGYNEGPAFLWPRDRAKILDHLQARADDELYWCPSLFEKPMRRMELAMDEHALWADLDEVDPHQLDEWRPSIAWETSPGRFQALWVINGGLMGASWAGNENQRLTYHLGADVSGWDTTQLLRVPGRPNRKFDYWVNGTREVPGRILWTNGPRYEPGDFSELPEVERGHGVAETLVEEQIERVDRHEVWGRVRLKVTRRTRELMSAKEAVGDRSETAWSIERDLADAGLTALEIVAVMRASVWNKFQGRADELKRLTIEASRAVEMKSSGQPDSLESTDAVERPDVQDLWALLSEVKPPEWLVAGVLSKGACGFIAGQPKNFKSWVSLDLMLSVSTGLPFLNHFSVRSPGPVLLIQEEDSAAMVKRRVQAIWPSKLADAVRVVEGVVEWHPANEQVHPPINALIRGGVVVSDQGWQSWLDEQISAGYNGRPYQLVLLDPLMMLAGEVDENRAQEMTTRVYRPLKILAEKHQCAIVVVHHMKKGDPAKPQRGGQLMLGSVANHAWAEDSMYLKFGRGGDVIVERESKHALGGTFTIKGLRRKGWEPTVVDDKTDETDEPTEGAIESDTLPKPRRKSRAKTGAKVEAVMAAKGRPASTGEIAERMSISVSGAYRQLVRAESKGVVERVGKRWKLTQGG